jgi:hypothetical protein
MTPDRKVCDETETELIFDMSQMPVKNRTVEQQKMKVVVTVTVTVTMMMMMMMMMMMNCFLTIAATTTAAAGYEMGAMM